MKNDILLLMASALFMLILGSCNSDSDSEADPGSKPINSADQVDIMVIVPIHSSSLEYFDYVIHYYDNRGTEVCDTVQTRSNSFNYDNNGVVQADTIRKENGALVVEDANNRAPESDGISCFVKSFSYDNLFVSCNVVVQMIPKKSTGSFGNFFFCSPKPCILANVNSSLGYPPSEAANHVANMVETVLIPPMSFDSFYDIYGYIYMSHCSVMDTYVGYEISFN